MPVYEALCQNVTCSERGKTKEYYSPQFRADDPPCEACGGNRRRLISRFGIVWTGEITARYNDKRAENPYASGAHWAWRRRSSVSGNPEPVRIESFQQQREFARQEGLVNPSDVNPNAEPSSDGKKLYTQGVKGQWV